MSENYDRQHFGSEEDRKRWHQRYQEALREKSAEIAQAERKVEECRQEAHRTHREAEVSRYQYWQRRVAQLRDEKVTILCRDPVLRKQIELATDELTRLQKWPRQEDMPRIKELNERLTKLRNGDWP